MGVHSHKKTVNRSGVSISGKGAGLLMGLLLCGCAYFLGQALMVFLFPSTQWPDLTQAASSQSVAMHHRVAHSPTRNPFFTGDSQSAMNESLVLPAVKETQLKLVIRGLRYHGSNPKNSRVALEYPDKKQRLLAAGDVVIAGVIVDSIRDDHIVLATKNGLETLSAQARKVIYTYDLKDENNE